MTHRAPLILYVILEIVDKSLETIICTPNAIRLKVYTEGLLCLLASGH